VTLRDVEAVGENLYSVTIMANEVARGPVELARRGIDYAAYRENPVVLWNHDHAGMTAAAGLPIGMTRKLVETATGEVRAWFQFLVGDPFVERLKNAWDQGFLRAASIGWRALETEPTPQGWRDTRSELLEWSLVPVPADPGALRSAYAEVVRTLIGDDALSPDDAQSPKGAQTLTADRTIFDHGSGTGADAGQVGDGDGDGTGAATMNDMSRALDLARELTNVIVRPGGRPGRR
jgi:hypothetical protein